MEMKGVSVIICCYNSKSRLPKTLEHLAHQTVLDSIPWEIVVVDNASIDNTKEVAINEWKKYNRDDVSFRIVNQPLQGLSFAREKGIEESKYDVLIFCDDDNLLCSTYIESAFLRVQSDIEIGAVGGYGESVYALPKWLNDFSEFYALGSQGERSGYVNSSRGCLYGAGLVLRKSLLEILKDKKFQRITTDRKGNSLVSGGDTELTFAIRILGYKLYYDDDLRFHHLIDHQRFKFKYFSKLIFGIGYSWASLLPYHLYFNKQKQRLPGPNFVDILYGLKAMSFAFIAFLFELVKINKREMCSAFVTLTFKSGGVWFMVSNFGCYKSVPPFLKQQT